MISCLCLMVTVEHKLAIALQDQLRPLRAVIVLGPQLCGCPLKSSLAASRSCNNPVQLVQVPFQIEFFSINAAHFNEYQNASSIRLRIHDNISKHVSVRCFVFCVRWFNMHWHFRCSYPKWISWRFFLLSMACTYSPVIFCLTVKWQSALCVCWSLATRNLKKKFRERKESE